jgi:hypothetical protein
MQLGQLQKNLTEFERRGAKLWAVSADPIEEAERLGKKLELTFPIGADPELKLIRQFGVEMEGREIAIPSMFVLEAQVPAASSGATSAKRCSIGPSYNSDAAQAIEQAGGAASAPVTTASSHSRSNQ